VLVGFSLAEALQKPKTPGSPWKGCSAARHRFPSWLPSSLIDRYALDHADTTKKLFPVAHEITHVLWVSLQIHGN
jgi:hypothetical protein